MSHRFYKVIGFGGSPLPAAVAHLWRAHQRMVRSVGAELADRVVGIDRGSDRLAFVIAAAADRRMYGFDPGAGAGCVDVVRPRAGPSRMSTRSDMKTLPNQALDI